MKNTNALLIGSFCLLVLAKAFLSLRFHSPWMMPDEVAYAKMAADIFGSVHPALSPGYPLFLSIAYLSSGDMNVVYHCMLLINCFLSSLILFPSYFILNKYCAKDFAIMGAVLVATLPSSVLYTFLIMTENLFIPIFLFSIWFLLQAYETEKPYWIFLAILSVALLFFTRHNGIFMVASMAVSLGYFLLSSGKLKDYSKLILYNSPPVNFAGFLILFLVISAIILNRMDGYHYLVWMYSHANTDMQIYSALFSNADNLKAYLVLLQNEIGYIIITTYFIFIVLSSIFFLHLFLPTNKICISSSLAEWFRTMSAQRKISLKSTSIYFLLIFIVLVPSTTTYVYRMNQEFPEGNWVLISRYIDPIIPAFFLFGLMALYKIRETPEKRSLALIAAFVAIFSAIFFIRFPALLNADIISIFFIKFFMNRAPNFAAFPAVAAGFFSLLGMYLITKRHKEIFFLALIIFSICASAYTYHQTFVYYSEKNNTENGIGQFLNAHADSDNHPIIMDWEDYQRDWYFSTLTSFWTKKEITYGDINGTLTDLKNNEKKEYLISSKVLQLETLAVSSRGYYLYSS
ncbi:MAG: glycosyltransferase family 39 protein [Methanothrix sp.]|uniref:glycosyltransferase family 39 protein n=1 Tax=Methanothrix sp. TaxID=90426 RepID=UPI0025DCB9A0|nr:glycosyltransferase family 39 protein [Methanothrix sp.]MBK7386524.1 glycosyltransferase family 39 protein [Methanothrix sp.]HQB07550.1 glycosyltransferase family 39 protein [Rectinema sp.]